MKFKAKFVMPAVLRRGLAAAPHIISAELTTALRETVQRVQEDYESRAPASIAQKASSEVRNLQGIVGSTDYRAGWLEEGVTILPMGSRTGSKSLAIPQTDEAARLQRGLKANRGLRGVPGLFLAPQGTARAVILHKSNPNLRWTLVPVVRIRPRRYLETAYERNVPFLEKQLEAAGKRVVNRIFGGGGQ